MAIAPAPPVHRALPVAYTAKSPAMTTCIGNLVTYLYLVLWEHLVQPTWQQHQHTCAPSTSCGIYCNITSYCYSKSCNSPLSSITEAFGPTNMAIAQAPPVQRAFPVAYTAKSPAMTTCIGNLVTYLCLVLLRHLVQPTWQ